MSSADPQATSIAADRLPPQYLKFTRRERALARMLLAGCSNRAMAEQSGVAVKTIKNQLTVLFGKVAVSSRLQLAMFLASHPELIDE